MWQVFNTHTGDVAATLPWRWLAHIVAVAMGGRFDYDPA